MSDGRGAAAILGDRLLLRQKEAALMLGVSVTYLRNSDCPKVLIPGQGKKGRPGVRYDPDDLKAWRDRWTTKAKAS